MEEPPPNRPGPTLPPDAPSYLDHVIGVAHRPLDGMRIVVDCANGAASGFAPDRAPQARGRRRGDQRRRGRVKDQCRLRRTVPRGGRRRGGAGRRRVWRTTAMPIARCSPMPRAESSTATRSSPRPRSRCRSAARLTGDAVVATVMANGVPPGDGGARSASCPRPSATATSLNACSSTTSPRRGAVRPRDLPRARDHRRRGS